MRFAPSLERNNVSAAQEALTLECSLEIGKFFFYIKEVDRRNRIQQCVRRSNIEIELRKG